MGTIRRKEAIKKSKILCWFLYSSILRDYTLNIQKITMQLTPDWICGFVEGEGSFVIYVSPSKSSKSTQVRLFFKIAQHVKNVQVLYAIKSFFGVGIVKRQRSLSAPSPVWEYVVSRFEHLDTKIIPFFEKTTMHSSKKFDFLRFRKVAIIMRRKDHYTTDGIIKIKSIASRMNKSVFYEEEP